MDRVDFEGGLEQLVRDNRVTIAVVFPLIGAVTLVTSAGGRLPAFLAFNPFLLLFGTVVMRLPLFATILPLFKRRAAVWFGLLVGYSYAIESIGLRTGWPYGPFTYTIDLGPMVGGVPVGLPVFFVPLLVNAYFIALLLTDGRRSTVPVALGFVLAIDLVLDPAAVALGFWTYPAGSYYGVPTSNYVGWLLSGSVGILAVDRAFDRATLQNRLTSVEFALDDLVSFVLLWGVVNALYGQWVPVLVATGIGLGLVGTDRFDVRDIRIAVDRITS